LESNRPPQAKCLLATTVGRRFSRRQAG
jgi:hypothetical protein